MNNILHAILTPFAALYILPIKKIPALKCYVMDNALKVYKTSLTDNGQYPAFCYNAATDDDIFSTFRTNKVYTNVLEHVDYETGAKYLAQIILERDVFSRIDNLKENDKFGGSVRVNYPEVSGISPSTLRYIKILTDLKRLFGSLCGLEICEIGVGYGGQCRIIEDYYDVKSYTLVDIPSALMLCRKYLNCFASLPKNEFLLPDDIIPRKFDLVISNYAFTELRREIQDQYLQDIILNSSRGYIIYNEITPAEFHSYKKDELLRIIPKAHIIPENPLTNPKNCIIVWGDK